MTVRDTSDARHGSGPAALAARLPLPRAERGSAREAAAEIDDAFGAIDAFAHVGDERHANEIAAGVRPVRGARQV
jgi:hypothetical protein